MTTIIFILLCVCVAWGVGTISFRAFRCVYLLHIEYRIACIERDVVSAMERGELTRSDAILFVFGADRMKRFIRHADTFLSEACRKEMDVCPSSMEDIATTPEEIKKFREAVISEMQRATWINEFSYNVRIAIKMWYLKAMISMLNRGVEQLKKSSRDDALSRSESAFVVDALSGLNSVVRPMH